MYIVWQAMRRLFRPGAPLPVSMLFPVYKGTVEAMGLALIIQKMMAAKLFYGQDVASGITEEAEGDLLHELVQAIIDKRVAVDADFGTEVVFESGQNLTSNTATGSPMHYSPVIEPRYETLEAWALAHAARRLVRGKKAKLPPQGQLTLF